MYVLCGIAYAKAFGIDRAPLPMTDIPLTDCILAAGVNVGECFPVMMQWVWRARDKGASLIVIDPRETPLAVQPTSGCPCAQEPMWPSSTPCCVRLSLMTW